ncbi:MAG: hypothetical protein RLZZ293_71 [Pseudomonadota bacterium]|jgi:hypothetical protein
MMIIFEIMAGLVGLGVLSLLSLILLPSLLGCGGLMIFWIIFLLALVLFSIKLSSIIIFIGIVYASLLVYKLFRYQQLPDYSQYLQQRNYPPHDPAPICHNCGSFHLQQNGLFGRSSKLRYYQCTTCRRWLYKFKVI